jgi:short/branched chain acyl-CoA dehydrogenase
LALYLDTTFIECIISVLGGQHRLEHGDCANVEKEIDSVDCCGNSPDFCCTHRIDSNDFPEFSRSGVNFELSEDEIALVGLADELARGEIAPIAQKAWDDERCPTEVLRTLGSVGLMGLLVEPKWGGIGMSTVGFVATLETLGKVDQSIAAAWQAHSTIGSIPLAQFGNDVQRERWLRPLAEGEALGSFGLTEPNAGSDVRGIETTASRVDGGWVINGAKAFISNAGTDLSYGVVVLAKVKTSSDAQSNDPMFGNFIVERGAKGYSWGPKLRGVGWRGLDTRDLYFDEVFVEDDHVLGDPNLGLHQFLSTLEVGRISIAALSNSLTAAVLELALEYAKTRKQFGRTLSSFQMTKFKFASLATELEASRWLTYRAAALRDSGKPFRKEAAMAKLKASQLAVAAASESVQVFGGSGYMMDSPVARFFCDSKVLEIGEGTNEMQHLVIAHELGCS